MSDTSHQSPLGVNTLSSLLQTKGFMINSYVTKYVGSSSSAPAYTLGEICKDTCLRLLTYSINIGYNGPLSRDTYGNLISIGSQTSQINPTSIVSDPAGFTVSGSFSAFPVDTIVRIVNVVPVAYNGTWKIIASSAGTFTVGSTIDPGPASTTGTVYFNSSIPALGNSKPVSFDWEGAPGWGGSSYKQTNAATQWGMVRLYAWQASNDFNFNNGLGFGYADFTASFNTAYSFIENTNQYILAMSNARYFLDGTYSNMNDLITADLAGVSLALPDFGQDLINLGKALDLSTINTFGLPSNLLRILVQNNGLSKAATLALIASGFSTSELGDLIGGIITPNPAQEQSIYNAFSIIAGEDLEEILISLNCVTKNLVVLADLLNPIKLLPNSYASLTVPVYNTDVTLLTAAETAALTTYAVESGPEVAIAVNGDAKFITQFGISYQEGLGTVKESTVDQSTVAPYFSSESTDYIGTGTITDPYRKSTIIIEVQPSSTPLASTANTNTQSAVPNSKIYYPVYGSGALNPALTSTSLDDKVGSYIPPVVPYTGFQTTTQGTQTQRPSNNTVYSNSISSSDSADLNSNVGSVEPPFGTTTTSGSGTVQVGPVRVGGVQNFDANGNWIEPVPPRTDPNWDYDKYNTSEFNQLNNVRHDQEYFADEFYKDKTPPQDLTGYRALPYETAKDLTLEYMRYYGIGYDGVIAYHPAPAGRVEITLPNGVPQPPLSVDQWVAQKAAEKGYLDSSGKSTLPLSTRQLREQEEWDRVYQPKIEAAIQRKLSGEQALAPGETIEDIRARAAKFNVPVTTNTGTTTRPSTQTNTGVSVADELSALKDNSQLQYYLSITNRSAAELAAASGYNASDIQAAIDSARAAAPEPVPIAVPIPVAPPPPPENPPPPPYEPVQTWQGY